LLEKVEADDLWLADRNFCTTNFLFGVAERRGYFLVRQHASTLHWEPTGRQKKVGENDSGTIYEQPAIAEDKEGNPLRLRRITIKLNKPTRDGTTEIHLLTNLSKRVRAKKLTDLYLKRWTIEHAFQELATAFNAEVESLGYPKAALFAFCIGLLSYNVFSVVRAALRAQYGTEKIENEVSVYYLTEEISRSWDGINVAVPAAYWSARFGHLTPAQLASVLLCLAKNVHLRRYRKHPRGPKRPPPKRSSGKRTKHVSTARILARRRVPT
jgi:hypothetical protein